MGPHSPPTTLPPAVEAKLRAMGVAIPLASRPLKPRKKEEVRSSRGNLSHAYAVAVDAPGMKDAKERRERSERSERRLLSGFSGSCCVPMASSSVYCAPHALRLLIHIPMCYGLSSTSFKCVPAPPPPHLPSGGAADHAGYIRRSRPAVYGRLGSAAGGCIRGSGDRV
jgi:hypothetical protein